MMERHPLPPAPPGEKRASVRQRPSLARRTSSRASVASSRSSSRESFRSVSRQGSMVRRTSSRSSNNGNMPHAGLPHLSTSPPLLSPGNQSTRSSSRSSFRSNGSRSPRVSSRGRSSFRKDASPRDGKLKVKHRKKKGRIHRPRSGKAHPTTSTTATLVRSILQKAPLPGWIFQNLNEEGLTCPSDLGGDKVAFDVAQSHIRDSSLYDKLAEFADKQDSWARLPQGKRGVSIGFLEDFARTFNLEGTKEQMNSATVFWMVQIISRNTGFSFSELVAGKSDSNGVPYVGPVGCYVCHAHSNEANQTFGALRDYAVEQTLAHPDQTTYFFIDIFCDNLDKSAGQPATTADVLMGRTEAMQAASTVLAVVHQWHNPAPLRRTWCLWELYQAMASGACRLELGFVPGEWETLLDAMRNATPGGYGPEKVAAVLTGNYAIKFAATARSADHRLIQNEMIAVVPGGAKRLDALISAKVHSSLLSLLLLRVEEMGEDADPDLLHGVGSIFDLEHKYAEAITYYERAVEKWEKTTVGGNLMKMAPTLNNLSTVYEKMENYEKASHFNMRMEHLYIDTIKSQDALMAEVEAIAESTS